METRRYGSFTLEVNNPVKLMFPEDSITKEDLLDYYDRIADVMLPHLHKRPVSLQRYPEGIDGEGFFQKVVHDYFPDWIDRVEIPKEGGINLQLTCEKKATLVYLANQASISLHAWLSRVDALNKPDRIVFDLDPPDGDFNLVRFAAMELRSLLEEVELPSYVMLTGSRGAHVVIPIRRKQTFNKTHTFAKNVAALLAQRHSDRLTVEMRKENRGNRLFVDYLRNSYGQTSVVPYSIRPRDGAPVATPVTWEEFLDPRTVPQRFSLKTIFKRLTKVGDPWESLSSHAVNLTEAARAVEEKIESE